MTTYTVDNTAVGASDSNAGTSSAPWLTLAKASTVATSGDTVLVRPGTFREQVTVKDGVTWRAAAPGVYVRGTVRVTGSWTAATGTAWSKAVAATAPMTIVLVDDVPLVAALSSAVAPGQFYYDTSAQVLYVDLGGDDPTGHVVEAGVLSTGFSLPNVTGCTVEGFEIYGQTSYGILMQGGGGHTFRGNEVMGAASGGIKLQPVSPQLFQPTDGGTGGALTAGTYYYVVTAVISGQETLPSFELGLTVAAGHKPVLQWSKIATASTFNIYGRTKAGETLLASVANSFGAGFPTWTDDGSLTPDGVTRAPVNSAVAITPCTITGNEVWRILSHGIYLYAAGGCNVYGNHSHHNRLYGIAMLNGANGNTVAFNTCHDNASIPYGGTRVSAGIVCDNFGIDTIGSSSNVIQYNKSFRNEDSGINVYNGSANCIVRRNVTYLNGDHGIDNSSSTGCHINGNLAYGNVTAGINAEGTSTGVRMYNNIAVDNGVQSPRTSGNYRVDNVANADAVVDNNLSYLTVPAASQPGVVGIANAEVTWGTTAYSTFDEFRTAVPSQMAHGVAADPQFTDLPDVDFHVAATSPARGLGTASAPDYSSHDFVGTSAAAPPTAGPFE